MAVLSYRRARNRYKDDGDMLETLHRMEEFDEFHLLRSGNISTGERVKKLTEKTEEPEKDTKEEKTEDRLSLFFQDLEEQLKGIMGTKVQIRRKDEKKGRIEIEYYSPEELERITELLQSLQG